VQQSSGELSQTARAVARAASLSSCYINWAPCSTIAGEHIVQYSKVTGRHPWFKCLFSLYSLEQVTSDK
jgi:hypothetical protein